MSLYACSRCGALENTALGDYWWQRHEGNPALCSECETGAWHGEFEKRLATKRDGVLNPEDIKTAREGE